MKYSKFLLSGAITLAAVCAYSDIRSVTPDAWGGNTNCWQMQRHNEKLRQIAEMGGAKVVFIGDSITHGWDGRESWKRFFGSGERRAVNLGFSADRTEHVLWRITKGGELDGYEARCVVLMIGTNNTGHNSFDKEPPVDTILGISKILNTIAEKQPKAHIILTSIFPRGATAGDPLRLRNETVNKEIAKFADGQRIVWCDFSDKYLDSEGNLSPEIFPDLLHPNDLGYEIWAGSAVPLIDKVLAAKPGEAIASVWPSSPRGYSNNRRSAIRPETRFPKGPWWDVRCLEKRNAIVANESGSFDIVMVGDSITHRWERENGEGCRLFAELSKRYKILNLGYGGDKTQNVLWRICNGELEGYKAGLFTVMIGTNNRERNPADVAAGIKAIVETIRKKHPESKIVLMPIFPRGRNQKDTRFVVNEKVNTLIRPLADGKDVVWLDFNSRFLNAKGCVMKEVMPDYLHPNEKGYQIWLDAIAPVFKEILGK